MGSLIRPLSHHQLMGLSLWTLNEGDPEKALQKIIKSIKRNNLGLLNLKLNLLFFYYLLLFARYFMPKIPTKFVYTFSVFHKKLIVLFWRSLIPFISYSSSSQIMHSGFLSIISRLFSSNHLSHPSQPSFLTILSFCSYFSLLIPFTPHLHHFILASFQSIHLPRPAFQPNLDKRQLKVFKINITLKKQTNLSTTQNRLDENTIGLSKM